MECECDGRFNDIAQCRLDQRYFQDTINLDFLEKPAGDFRKERNLFDSE